jgi:hypothetical protein
MRVRLIRKLASRIDGIDLTGRSVGDVVDLPELDARVLVAEQWATTEERRSSKPDSAQDAPRRRPERRRRRSPPLE